MKKIYNIKISTILMVALPILSIFIGYFGVKLFLLSNNSYDDSIEANRPGVEEIIENNDDEDSNITGPNESTNNEEVLSPSSESSNEEETTNEKMATKKIDAISFYSIQVGSFSSEENARQFQDEFTNDGLYSFITKETNYKVFVQVSYNKEYLEGNIEKIREYSSDAFIKNVTLSSKNFSYVVKDTDYFAQMADMISNQVNSFKPSVNLDEIENKLNLIEETNLNFINVDERNKNIGNKITNYINDIKKKITETNSNSDEEVQLLLKENIELFLKYFG